MIKHQGENIDFLLEIEQLHDTDVKNWSEIKSLTIYFFTHQSHIAKYCYPNENGYNPLTLNDEHTLRGTINSDDTIKMNGVLNMELLVELNNDIQIEKIPTNIRILPVTIKQEV